MMASKIVGKHDERSTVINHGGQDDRKSRNIGIDQQIMRGKVHSQQVYMPVSIPYLSAEEDSPGKSSVLVPSYNKKLPFEGRTMYDMQFQNYYDGLSTPGKNNNGNSLLIPKNKEQIKSAKYLKSQKNSLISLTS